MKLIKCLKCGSSSVDEVLWQKQVLYKCYLCDKIYSEAEGSDSRLKLGITESGEEYHYATGLFVRRPNGQFLLTRNNLPPFSWDLLYGHMHNDESEKNTAKRKSLELTGYEPRQLKLIYNELLPVHWCRYVSLHKMHIYELIIPDDFAPFSIFPGPHSGELHWLDWQKLKERKYRPLGKASQKILKKIGTQYA